MAEICFDVEKGKSLSVCFIFTLKEEYGKNNQVIPIDESFLIHTLDCLVWLYKRFFTISL